MKKFPIVGTLLGALAVSLCCLGPACLAALGLGSLGAAAFFAKAHWLFWAIGSLVFGGSLWIFVKERKKEACCETEPSSRKVPVASLLLLVSLFLFGAYGFSRWLAPSLYSLQRPSPASGQTTLVSAPARVEVAVFTISKMDCPLCAVGIQASLKSLPGIYAAQVSYDQKKAVVCFDARQISVKQIQAKINETGYPGKLVKSRTCPKPGLLNV